MGGLVKDPQEGFGLQRQVGRFRLFGRSSVNKCNMYLCECATKEVATGGHEIRRSAIFFIFFFWVWAERLKTLVAFFFSSFRSVCASPASSSLLLALAWPLSDDVALLYRMHAFRTGPYGLRMTLLVAFVLGLLTASSLASADPSLRSFTRSGMFIALYQSKISFHPPPMTKTLDCFFYTFWIRFLAFDQLNPRDYDMESC